MQANISVIMPAYNCERYVKQAIDSVLSQDAGSFEVLIADDASNDRTKEIIDSYKDPRIKRYHNSSNLGYLKASNKLLREATGNYIVFQDADDYAAPQRFERLASYLDSNTDTFAVGSNVVAVDENGKELSVSDFPLEHNAILEHFRKYRTPIVGSALMFRKEILNTIGSYHEYFDRIGWEDFYWYSLIIQRYKVANLKEGLYYYRSNPSSVSMGNRSFRSVAGFHTIVHYLNERLNGREDHIALGNYDKVDEMNVRFYVGHKISKGESVSFSELSKMAPSYLSALKLWMFANKQRKAIK